MIQLKFLESVGRTGANPIRVSANYPPQECRFSIPFELSKGEIIHSFVQTIWKNPKPPEMPYLRGKEYV
jgi:hypothetical protein